MHDEQFKKKKKRVKKIPSNRTLVYYYYYYYFVNGVLMVYLFIFLFCAFWHGKRGGIVIVMARQVVGLFIHIVYYVIKLEY